MTGSADSNTSTNTDPVKEYTDTSVQTSHTEFVSQIPLATYINIRKRLNELQHQQRLENQCSIGTDTETNTINFSMVRFTISNARVVITVI